MVWASALAHSSDPSTPPQCTSGTPSTSPSAQGVATASSTASSTSSFSSAGCSLRCIYQSLPECASSAILVFVGLILGRQAFEETPPRHYPALLLSLFPYLCHWAKPGNSNEGIQMMGQGGGMMFSVVLTCLFCLCIDRGKVDSLFELKDEANEANEEVKESMRRFSTRECSRTGCLLVL